MEWILHVEKMKLVNREDVYYIFDIIHVYVVDTYYN